MSHYPHQDVEPKWQQFWIENKTFRLPDDFDTSKPKYYVLDMFPYPSGAGLHVGHPEGYTATDILARYKRMRGFNVLHPIGWDAFGLPAEQYAIQTNVHPAISTAQNVNTFRKQLQALGFSYDWDREVDTTDPNYYKWTQWIFQQLYKKDLAYLAEVPVNWCPALGTVLSNEEVIDGKSERGGHPVERFPMKQWMLRITSYAERLLADLDDLDWSDALKTMQRNWIGKSVGATVDFGVKGHEAKISVFTTRPDTLFGATYMVLAPEHPLVNQITTPAFQETIQAYQRQASLKSDLDRTDLAKSKSGAFTGAYAINPVNEEAIPIWISDYVLISYGTGAIMAVPAHDQRDFEFATMFDLPIVPVLEGGDITKEAFTADGRHINSTHADLSLDGLNKADAISTVIHWLTEKGLGKESVNYKLRDWLFSRQRYWGEPFPLIHTDEGIKLVPENDLPVLLPELDDFKPTGSPEPLLSKATDWVKTIDPETGKTALRETNTMPQWAGSCWYYLRYIDPQNPNEAFDKTKADYWLPVDLYVGGAEHAVLHLLYARFWHKVLFDCGLVSTKEPFQKLVNQGMILGEMEFNLYQDESGNPISFEKVAEPKSTPKQKLFEKDVEKKGDFFVWKENPDLRIEGKAAKMSKSRGNVINPDDIVREYGADALRLYEMFMGPLEQMKPWSMNGVGGVRRFLDRIWRLLVNDEGYIKTVNRVATQTELKSLHQTLKKVTDDIEAMRFNTGISAMMEFVNEAYKWENIPQEIAESFILLLSPYAPHIAEELWQKLGHEESLAYTAWRDAEAQYLVEDMREIGVQINGKLRATIQIKVDANAEEALSIAKENHNVQQHLVGLTIRKEIYVPGRIVNIVAN